MEKRNKEARVRTNSLFFLNVHIILKFIISGFLVSCIFSGQIPSEYFQQFVEYEIDVELNDENHTLSAYLKLNYITKQVMSRLGILLCTYPERPLSV